MESYPSTEEQAAMVYNMQSLASGAQAPIAYDVYESIR